MFFGKNVGGTGRKVGGIGAQRARHILIYQSRSDSILVQTLLRCRCKMYSVDGHRQMLIGACRDDGKSRRVPPRKLKGLRMSQAQIILFFWDSFFLIENEDWMDEESRRCNAR